MFPRPLRSTLFPYTTLFRSTGQTGGMFGKITDVRKGGVAFAHFFPILRGNFVARTASQLLRDGMSLVRELCVRSEEHTSELQSPYDLVCRLLLEKKKKDYMITVPLLFLLDVPTTTQIYTLSLHDALPIYRSNRRHVRENHRRPERRRRLCALLSNSSRELCGKNCKPAFA